MEEIKKNIGRSVSNVISVKKIKMSVYLMDMWLPHSQAPKLCGFTVFLKNVCKILHKSEFASFFAEI